MSNFSYDDLTKEQLVGLLNDRDKAIERQYRLVGAMKKAAKSAVEIAYWMSGSKDFSPEGQAWAGWQKARTELAAIEDEIRHTPVAGNYA